MNIKLGHIYCHKNETSPDLFMSVSYGAYLVVNGGDFIFVSLFHRPDFQTSSKQRGFKEDPYIFFEKGSDFFDNIK